MLIYMDEVFTEGEKKHHLLKKNTCSLKMEKIELLSIYNILQVLKTI